MAAETMPEMERQKLTNAVNPEPLTSHPKPETLNPEPSTLHPQPSTLNPEP